MIAKPVDSIGADKEELSLAALKGRAVEVLRDVLTTGSSDDVKRKAAVDILNFGRERSSSIPVIREEDLEFLGKVIVETEAIRLGSIGGEDSPR
jgi:hypothetical protein